MHYSLTNAAALIASYIYIYLHFFAYEEWKFSCVEKMAQLCKTYSANVYIILQR